MKLYSDTLLRNTPALYSVCLKIEIKIDSRAIASKRGSLTAQRRSRQSLIFRATDPFSANWKTRAASERDSRSSEDTGFLVWPRSIGLEGTFHTEKLVRAVTSPFILRMETDDFNLNIFASKIIFKLPMHNITNGCDK